MSSRRHPNRAPGAFSLPQLRAKTDSEIINLATELAELVRISNSGVPGDEVAAINAAKEFRERWGVTDINKVRKQVSAEYNRRHQLVLDQRHEQDVREALVDIEFARRPWTPFTRGNAVPFDENDPKTKADIDNLVASFAHLGITREQAIAQYREVEKDEIFLNSKYQVNIRRSPVNIEDHDTEMVHLSIKRLDKRPVRDWRDFQRIKDELLGRQCEAIEMFPAQDRMVDTANQYHLWGIASTDYRFPFGWSTRAVADAPLHPEDHHMRQRPLDGAHADDEGIETYPTPPHEQITAPYGEKADGSPKDLEDLG